MPISLPSSRLHIKVFWWVQQTLNCLNWSPTLSLTFPVFNLLYVLSTTETKIRVDFALDFCSLVFGRSRFSLGIGGFSISISAIVVPSDPVALDDRKLRTRQRKSRFRPNNGSLEGNGKTKMLWIRVDEFLDFHNRVPFLEGAFLFPDSGHSKMKL